MSKSLAIIPARGGSKRIPRKNIKSFLGKPIIGYSIEAAISSGCFNEVMVSTDDHEIAGIAKKYGATVPFFRSKENSDDYAMLADVIEEVVKDYKEVRREFDYVCCILSTAPFITAKKLLQARTLLEDEGAEGVVPIARFSFPIQRALKIENDRAVMVSPENYNVRSQDLTTTYHDSGQFYYLKTDSFLEQKKMYLDDFAPLIVSPMEVQDIDDEEDWLMAELKYNMLIGQGLIDESKTLLPVGSKREKHPSN